MFQYLKGGLEGAKKTYRIEIKQEL